MGWQWPASGSQRFLSGLVESPEVGVIMSSGLKRTLKNGDVVWRAKYQGYDGRWHEEGRYRSCRDAERAAMLLEANAERGIGVAAVDARLRFQEYAETRYWPTTAHLSPTTRAVYRVYLDKHFLPAFGALPLRRVTAPIIQKWVNDVSRGGLSPKSIKTYMAMLNTLFNLAVKDQRLPRNPCVLVALPKVVKKERRALTPEQFEGLLAAVPQGHRTLVTTAMETGCRWGELMALRPADIDWETHEVLVQRAMLEVPRSVSPTGERYVIADGPKEGEWRRVQVTPALLSLLREHMLERGIRSEDLLFGTSVGTPMSRNTFRTRVWQPARVAAGLPKGVTPHLLRHSHASWLLAGGADLVVVMNRLGHRQIQTTQGYLHSMPDAGDRALAALDRFKQSRSGARTSPRTALLP